LIRGGELAKARVQSGSLLWHCVCPWLFAVFKLGRTGHKRKLKITLRGLAHHHRTASSGKPFSKPAAVTFEAMPIRAKWATMKTLMRSWPVSAENVCQELSAFQRAQTQ
jgi:hypothetical protein